MEYTIISIQSLVHTRECRNVRQLSWSLRDQPFDALKFLMDLLKFSPIPDSSINENLNISR